MSLKISPELSLPLRFVTLTQAILAKKGAGKSYTAAVQAEEMLAAKQQVVIVDPTGAWWGLKSSADGKSAGYPVAIFGGDHGDIPLEDTAGELIATAIVQQRFSAIIDLSLFRKGQTLRFMAPFLETLYRLNREPLHLIVDEADAIAPQRPMGEDARTLGAIEDVVRRGRIKGIGCTLITQRPQVLNKNVLTQADILCALRMTHPKDIDAIKEWVNVHGDPAVARQMIESLPSLPTGEAWFWAPEAGNIFKRIKVRERTTFNSSSTPKPGEKVVAPKVLAQIDIQALGEKIAATVQKAKEESPAALKARIRELELAAQKAPAIDPALNERIAKLESAREEAVLEWARWRNAHAALVGTISTALDLSRQETEGRAYAKDIPAAPVVATVHPKGSLPVDVVQSVAKAATATVHPSEAIPEAELQARWRNAHFSPKPVVSGETLRSGAERMLAALAQWYPHGRTEAQWATQVGMKRTGGTWGTYKSELRKAGYMEQRSDRSFVATADGVAHLGSDLPAAPQTTAQVVSLWESKLRSGAVYMLRVLINHKGRPVDRGDLARMVNMEVTGGTFGTYLSDLRTTGLVITEGRSVRANAEVLFL